MRRLACLSFFLMLSACGTVARSREQQLADQRKRDAERVAGEAYLATRPPEIQRAIRAGLPVVGMTKDDLVRTYPPEKICRVGFVQTEAGTTERLLFTNQHTDCGNGFVRPLYVLEAHMREGVVVLVTNL